MNQVPEVVLHNLHRNGGDVTCIPVSMDAQPLQAMMFFCVSGDNQKKDREALGCAAEVAIELDVDVIKTDTAAIISLRAEVFARPMGPQAAPLIGEVLMIPGQYPIHFRALKLLTQQPTLSWVFFEDSGLVVHSRSHGLEDAAHGHFKQQLDLATAHDSVIRLAGRYDSQQAIGEVVAHYQPGVH